MTGSVVALATALAPAVAKALVPAVATTALAPAVALVLAAMVATALVPAAGARALVKDLARVAVKVDDGECLNQLVVSEVLAAQVGDKQAGAAKDWEAVDGALEKGL